MRTTMVLLFLGFFSMRCDFGTSLTNPPAVSDVGSVSFSLAKSSFPSDVKILVARLERQGFQTISDSVTVVGAGDTVKIHMVNIPVGTWNVALEARDAAGITRYVGKGSVAVSLGQLATLYVYMTPTTGGEIQIVAIWGDARFRWTMSGENPVLRQTSGSWDQDHYYFDDPSILKINGVFHAWYSSGYNLSISRAETLFIAHATSLDGIHWTKTGLAMAPGASGSWRDKGQISPCVLYDGGIYRMWFVGMKNPLQYQNGIGYATSLDGLNWDVDAQPVIPLGSTVGATWHPAVVKKDNQLYLFVGTSSSSTIYSMDVTLFTSSDGRTWTNRGAVLSARTNLAWQKSGILPSEVVYDENRFKMFFTAVETQTISIGYAESLDGIAWTGMSTSPILTSSSTLPWTTTAVGFPAVMRDGGKLKMWFSAVTTNPQRYQIGYAELVQ